MAQMNYRLVSQPYVGTEADLQDVLFPARTSAELASATNRINTEDKFVGKPVYDSTIEQTVYASGAAAADAWIANNPALAVDASAGITGFAGAHGSSVIRAGGLVYTRIMIDLDGLESGDAGDIIGDATPSISHLGQITVARNGTLLYGQVTCIETPAGGDPDIDLYSADEDTGVQDTAISSLTNTAQLINSGDWTGAIQTPEIMANLPADGQYLYMVDVGGTAVEYSAGIFLYEFFGT